MSSRSSAADRTGLNSAASDNHTRGWWSFSHLGLSAWCGLVAGLLETGITFLRKRYVDVNHANQATADAVWLIPSVNLVVFAVIGAVLSLVVCRGERARWIAMRALGTLALLPLFWAAFPRIYAPASLLLAVGVSGKLVPALERRAAGLTRIVRLSFPVAVCLVLTLAVWCRGSDWLRERQAESRPIPSPGSPNVLLIVLDTVGAGHLSLFGYDRITSPTIDELGERGISFNRAHSTAPWTLPSHASMFTGRWPHELSAGWLTPLNGAFPTVANYLSSRNYATAGFAANLEYCTYDLGLARGFTTYRDFIYPNLAVFHLAVIVDRVLNGAHEVESFFTNDLDLPFLKYPTELVWHIFRQDRKQASVVNREFLDWLSNRQRPERPFFSFLNYYDAHHPYEIPAPGLRRFGAATNDGREVEAIRNRLFKQMRMPSKRLVALARDSYDNCVADLDEQLGKLFDELRRRGVLERTWVIITGDHGENFGEHPGVFLHGTTVYQTECHVPLLIIPPGGAAARKVVAEPVSLRDLAATIVDVTGFSADSPFPGDSLARFWDASSRSAHTGPTSPNAALVELAPQEASTSPVPSQPDELRWPLAALIDGGWSYIRREGHVDEQLFRVQEDTNELHNLAADPAVQPTLERMRKALDHLTRGPLTPERFNP